MHMDFQKHMISHLRCNKVIYTAENTGEAVLKSSYFVSNMTVQIRSRSGEVRMVFHENIYRT